MTLPDRENEPITMGLTSGYDFFGGHAVYVEGFAQYTACKNSIRTELYELLDFPSYLAEQAAGDAEANAPDPFRIDMWTLHSGATYALTHFFKGKEGSSLDGFVRTANDVLFNPEGTVERAREEYERQVETGDDGD